MHKFLGYAGFDNFAMLSAPFTDHDPSLLLYLLLWNVHPALSYQLSKIVLVVAQRTLEKVSRRLCELRHASPMKPSIMTARSSNGFQPPVRSHIVVANSTGFRLRMFFIINQFNMLVTPGLERIHIMRQTTILKSTIRVKRSETFLGATRYIGIPLLTDVAFLASNPSFLVPDFLFHESKYSLIIISILNEIGSK